jgi:hypothetical protein
MMDKRAFLSRARRYHRVLLWPALLALVLFVLSGLLHILVTWTGPQAMQPMPPRAVFPAADWAAMPRLLQQHGISQAQAVKLVPSQGRNLLQVTTDDDSARRYFDLVSGVELPAYDAQQAQWLAQHYLQDAHAKPESIEFLTQFDKKYPWVNRLLPVYRLHFAGDDQLTLTVHTETGALADISNDWKRTIQTGFQYLHTAAWLDSQPALRMVLMLSLLSSVLGAVLAGAGLLYGIRRKNQPKKDRRWHRCLAHVLWLPVFGFTGSGLYHLLHSEYAQPVSNVHMAQPLRLPVQALAMVDPARLPTKPLQSVALLSLPDGRVFYRASEAVVPAPSSSDPHAAHTQRQARFDGMPKEQAAHYMDALTGAPAHMTDEVLARALANQYLPAAAIVKTQKLNRFGEGYDFRNKRLPVWRVDLATPEADTLYIDASTGVLADRSTRASRLEGLSFSTLHKWNLLTPLLGRPGRDGLMVAVLSLVLVLGWLGWRLRGRQTT